MQTHMKDDVSLETTSKSFSLVKRNHLHNSWMGTVVHFNQFNNLCQRGFTLGIPVSSHSQKTCKLATCPGCTLSAP